MPGLFWPMQRGYIVTSGFGPRWGTVHYGTDFGWPGGSANRAVHAVQGGTVVMVGPASGFGQWVVVDHPTADGSGTTVYGHVIPEVRNGQRVEAGQRIARINPDRNTNGGVDPHLHLEWHRYVWTQNKADRLDPLPKLSGARFPGESAPAPTPAPAPAPATPGRFVGEFATTHTLLTSADSGKRAMPPQLQVLHTNEGGPYARGKSPGTVTGLLQFCANLRNQASYNTIVGRAGDTGRSNSDNYAPWAAGTLANARGLHLCALGWSAQPRDEWLGYTDQMQAIARILAHNAAVYGIPLRRINAEQIKAGERGICGHGDVAAAWRETDHTDPGANFPYDDVIARAVAINNGGSAGDADMNEIQAKQLDRLHTEFTQRYASRSRKATDPTALVDTAVGFVLNTDARVHELSIEIPENFTAVRSELSAIRTALAQLLTQKVG